MNRTYTRDGMGNVTTTNGIALPEPLPAAGGVTVHYHYDLNGRLIAETDGAGNPIRDYVYIDGEPVAMQVYGAGAEWYWFLNDHLGTPQKLVDSAGAVVWQAAYMPFGEARVLTADIENNLRFPGQYYDAETGLHYNWHRYYDPETGRYLRPDPIGLAGGINLFAYVQNNPINFTDRYGLFVDDTISPAIAAAIGAGMIATYEGSKRALKWLVNNWNESTENNESDACPESTPIKPPFRGEPGSTVQGKKQSRQYVDDGKPLIDRDLPHPGGPKKEREDHSHDWEPDGRGPARDPQPGDPPQPTDLVI